MSVFKNILLAVSLIVLLVSCEKDSKEKIAGESFENMEQLVSVLKTVNNKESAVKAKPQLELIVEKLIELQSRAKALSLSDKEMNEELMKNKEKMDSIKSEMRAIQEKIGKDMEVAQVLGATLGKVK